MFKIVNPAGIVLEINPSDKITIEKNNPLFNNDDSIFQDFSYAGKAGFSENNNMFFGLGNFVESRNSTYTFPIQMLSGTEVFLLGNIKYRVGTDGYEYHLEPNLAAITSLIKNVKVNDILSEDADYSFGSLDFTGIENLMLDTVRHPDRHNMVFCPVGNLSYDLATTYIPFQFVNYFDKDAQKFVAKTHISRFGSSYDMYTYLSPYYKLLYMLKVFASYLGFTASGSIFSDPEFAKKYIFTRQAIAGLGISQSTQYMPGMLLSDCLKQLRQRYHLALDFDLNSGILSIETFRSVINSAAIDITPYITSVIEQELPDTTGATVTLKTDDQDAAFLVTVDDQDTYPPLFQLNVGDGSTNTELDCSTLLGVDTTTGGVRGERYAQVNQTTFQENFVSDGSTFDNTGDILNNNQFPLRTFEFLGYNEISPGVFYPESGPDDLDEDDILYYQFLNDSKRLIINAVMPPVVIAQMRTTSKYTFKTAGYNYCNIIFEKLSYDIGINDEVVRVKIYARTIDFDVETPVSITPVQLAADDGYTRPDGSVELASKLKAYFDPQIHGISQVDVEIVDLDGVTDWKAKPVVNPANYKGTGGVGAGIYQMTLGSGDPFAGQELRIRQGVPKYLIRQGVRSYFTLHPSGQYYYVAINLRESPYSGFLDYYTIFF